MTLYITTNHDVGNLLVSMSHTKLGNVLRRAKWFNVFWTLFQPWHQIHLYLVFRGQPSQPHDMVYVRATNDPLKGMNLGLNLCSVCNRVEQSI